MDDAFAVHDDAVAVEDDEVEARHQSSSVRRPCFSRECLALLSSRRSLRGARRFGLAPDLRDDERTAHEVGEPFQSCVLVLLLAAKLLRLDDDDTVARDAVVAQREQALPNRAGEHARSWPRRT